MKPNAATEKMSRINVKKGIKRTGQCAWYAMFHVQKQKNYIYVYAKKLWKGGRD